VAVSFSIPGAPRGKGRPKFARRGQGVVTYTDDKTASYENLAKLACRDAMAGAPPMTGAICANITSYFPVPKSASKMRRAAMLQGIERPTKKPDRDNIEKAILDGINGVAFVDDAQVCDGRSSKWYSETPRVEVELHEIASGATFPLAA
jgi:Holliday junction resolvase RusA-like endonuclease